MTALAELSTLNWRIDATLSTVKHIDHNSRSAYLEIRRISSIRHLQTTKATAQLMCSFVLIRLDYCNSLLIDITHQLDQMYSWKRFKTTQRKLFLARADMNKLDHCSKHFTGC